MRRLLFACCVLASSSGLAAQEFTTLKGHGGPIMGIAVSLDGQVATASFDNSVGVWEDRRPVWLEAHDAAVTSVAYGADGTLVSGGDDFAVRVWGDVPRELGRHKGKVTSVAVSPGGTLVASGSWDGTIRVWSLDGAPGEELSKPGAGVSAVAFGGSDDEIYATTSAGRLLFYDLSSGGVVPLVKNGFGINKLVVGPDWIAYGAVDGVTRVIDRQSGDEVADFTLDRRPILAMAYHEGTGQLAVGDAHGYIMMLDTVAWKITRDFRAARRGPVWALAFSPDGSVIHAGGIDDVAYSWPVEILDEFDPEMGQERSFLRDPASMPNGERQFMRKCSICHAVEDGPSRKAGPTLFGVFGRRAGTVPGYPYSPTLRRSEIIWNEDTIDALFDMGPDHYIPGSKMPMQVIAGKSDRAALIAYLLNATKQE